MGITIVDMPGTVCLPLFWDMSCMRILGTRYFWRRFDTLQSGIRSCSFWENTSNGAKADEGENGSHREECECDTGIDGEPREDNGAIGSGDEGEPQGSYVQDRSHRMKQRYDSITSEFIKEGKHINNGERTERQSHRKRCGYHGGGKGSNDKQKFKRLDMPIFSGETLDAWLFKTERYFKINQLSDAEKIKVAIISFDHEVVDWYRWAHNRWKFRTWADLKARLFERICSMQEGSLCSKFLGVKQSTTRVPSPARYC